MRKTSLIFLMLLSSFTAVRSNDKIDTALFFSRVNKALDYVITDSSDWKKKGISVDSSIYCDDRDGQLFRKAFPEIRNLKILKAKRDELTQNFESKGYKNLKFRNTVYYKEDFNYFIKIYVLTDNIYSLVLYPKKREIYLYMLVYDFIFEPGNSNYRAHYYTIMD